VLISVEYYVEVAESRKTITILTWWKRCFIFFSLACDLRSALILPASLPPLYTYTYVCLYATIAFLYFFTISAQLKFEHFLLYALNFFPLVFY